jgi:hypothetical protein
MNGTRKAQQQQQFVMGAILIFPSPISATARFRKGVIVAYLKKLSKYSGWLQKQLYALQNKYIY